MKSSLEDYRPLHSGSEGDDEPYFHTRKYSCGYRFKLWVPLFAVLVLSLGLNVFSGLRSIQKTRSQPHASKAEATRFGMSPLIIK